MCQALCQVSKIQNTFGLVRAFEELMVQRRKQVIAMQYESCGDRLADCGCTEEEEQGNLSMDGWMERLAGSQGPAHERPSVPA